MGGRVLVIGGGVIGMSVALRTRQAGFEVTLLERGPTPGAEASSAAAGILGPQIESPGPGPLLELCLRSRASYRAFSEELQALSGVDVEYRDHGALLLALSLHEAHRLEAVHAWQRAAGLRAELLDGEAARGLEPGLSKEIQLAVSLPDDHQVDNRKLVEALRGSLRAVGVTVRRGVARGLVHQGRRAAGALLESGERLSADWTVVAAGAWSTLLPELLPPEAVQPARGQMLLYQLGSPPPFRRVLVGELGYLVARDDGRVLAGSTLEYVGYDARVTSEGLGRIRAAVEALLPALVGQTPVDQWANLRPSTADQLPVLGPGPLERLVFATGHFRNGILLAPLTARVVAELVSEKAPVVSLAPFHYGRFARA